MKAIIVGAGLAGSAAAFKLRQAGWQVKIIESNDYVGGRANTVIKQGYKIDTAASGLVTSYHAYLGLAKEIGVRDQIVPASPILGLVRNNKVHELNMNRMLWSGMLTGLLSFTAKLSLMKLFYHAFSAKRKGMLNWNDLGKAAPIDNESVATYAMREFSEEVNNYFCDPVVRVMLLTNGDNVSKVEFFSGVANVLQEKMCSLSGGQQGFPERLVRDCELELNSQVTQVNDNGEQASGKVTVEWKNQQGNFSETVDACVVATTLKTAVAMCEGYRSLLEPLSNTMRYTKAVSISVGVSVLVSTKSFMLFVPNCEEKNIATLFLEHNKNADRAPVGHSLITAYFEESSAEQLWAKTDAQLADIVHDYLYTLFPEIKDKVDMTHVKRWNPALPLMKIGGYAEVASIHQRINHRSRVQFAGDYLSGAGQNTAVDFGIKAAQRIIATQS